MWDTILVVLCLALIALLGLAVLQRLEFRSVFRRRPPVAAPDLPERPADDPSRSGKGPRPD